MLARLIERACHVSVGGAVIKAGQLHGAGLVGGNTLTLVPLEQLSGDLMPSTDRIGTRGKGDNGWTTAEGRDIASVRVTTVKKEEPACVLDELSKLSSDRHPGLLALGCRG